LPRCRFPIFGGRITGCLGFAIYRIVVKAGTETCLPALATFPNQDATAPRMAAQDPVQKFFWKDVYAKRGGSYSYRIVPMGGRAGALTPMSVGSLMTNVVQLTPDYGVLSAYFNRGILATQATAHALHTKDDLNSMKAELLQRIADQNDPLRLDLAGQMISTASGSLRGQCAGYIRSLRLALVAGQKSPNGLDVSQDQRHVAGYLF
jgi:hypothetical protein